MLSPHRISLLQHKLQRQHRFEFIKIQDQTENQAALFEAESHSIDPTLSSVNRQIRIIDLLRTIDRKLDSINANSVLDQRHHRIFAEVDAMFREVKSLRSAEDNQY